MNAVFAKKTKQKRRGYCLPLFLITLDYEKAYEKVNRDKVWSIQSTCNLHVKFLNRIKAPYGNVSVITKVENKTEYASTLIVTRGLRYGC